MNSKDWKIQLAIEGLCGQLDHKDCQSVIADLAACEAERDGWKELAEVSGFDLSIRAERDRLQADSTRAIGVVADLISERDEYKRLYYCSGSQEAWEVLEAERDDLRRKLEVALESADSMKAAWNAACSDLDREKAESDKAVEELRGRLEEERRKMADASLANAALRTALDIIMYGSSVAAKYRDGQAGWHEVGCGWVTHATKECNCRLGDKLAALLALPVDGLVEEARWLLENFPNGMDAPIYVEWWKRRTDLLARIGGGK